VCRDMDYVWRELSMRKDILVDEKKYVMCVMQMWRAFAANGER
jgi:hypothetical protein